MFVSNFKNLIHFKSKTQILELFIILLIGTVEFLMIYSKDLPPSYSYSIIPKSIQTKMDLSIYTDAFSENNFAFFLSPITLIMSAPFNSSLMLYLTFIIGFLSMYFFVKYFSLKYMSVSNIFILDFVSIVISSLYVNTYYFGGGSFFNYSLYYSMIPIILITLDKYFDTSSRTKLTLIKQSLIIALILSISTLDIRTLVYNIFIFLYFVIFMIAYDHSIIKLKRTVFMVFWVAILYILINIKFIIIIIAERSTATGIISSVVPAQIYIALQRFSLLYALAGAQTWYTVYNSAYVYLGLIPLFVGLTLIMNSNITKIFALLYIPLLILIFLSTNGGNTVFFYLAQTKLYPYLVIIYPYYLMGALYDGFLYTLFGLATFNIVNKLYIHLSEKRIFTRFKIKRNRIICLIKISVVIIVVIIVTMPVEYYLEPQERTVSSTESVNLPSYIRNITAAIYSLDLTGNIYLYGSVSGQEVYLTDIPNLIWSNYPAAPSNVVQFILSSHTNNLGNVIAYFGIQFVIYIYNGNVSMLSYIRGQNTLKLITEQHNILLFENLHYVESAEFKNKLYIGFETPYIFKYLNGDSQLLPIIPFYNIKNFTQIRDFVTGVVGVNISEQMLMPLFLNQTNSYKIDTGSMSINNWPNGWGLAPVGGIGSDISAIFPYSDASLKLKSSFPNGEYYVIVEGGSFRYGYGISQASMNLSSGKSNATLFFNQTMFSPYVQYSNIQEMNLTNGTIYLRPVYGTPFVSSIYLIPIDKYDSIINIARFFWNTHTIINVINNNLSVTNNTFSNKRVNFTLSLIFTNEISPSGAYFNTINVEKALYHFTYNYGLGEVYVSFDKQTVIIENVSALYTLYVSALIDMTLLTLLFKLRKFRD